MSDGTGIQWTDATWNPTTGCTKVSPGCANCYIERTPAFRINHRKFVNGATDLRLHEGRLEQPLRWKKPKRIFVNSLSDLFHQDVPDAFIDKVFAVMAMATQHTFQILTKRPERMRAYLTNQLTALDVYGQFQKLPGYDRIVWLGLPLPNVWLGVSVENQHFADERIPLLLQTPAAVRFISAELLLGAVDLRPWLSEAGWAERSAQRQVHGPGPRLTDLGSVDARTESAGSDEPAKRGVGRPRLDWVIVGGESGPGARPFDVAWARSIVQQCKGAGVACFVKQLGARPIFPDGGGHEGFQSDKKGGDPSEWPADLSVRQFPEIR